MNIGFHNFSSGSINGLVNINANSITADDITTNSIEMSNLKATKITATDLTVTNILKTKDYANIDTEIGNLKTKTQYQSTTFNKTNFSGSIVATNEIRTSNNVYSGQYNLDDVGQRMTAITEYNNIGIETTHMNGYLFLENELQCQTISLSGDATANDFKLTNGGNLSNTITKTQYQSASNSVTNFNGNVTCSNGGNLQTAMTRTQYQSATNDVTTFSGTVTSSNIADITTRVQNIALPETIHGHTQLFGTLGVANSVTSASIISTGDVTSSGGSLNSTITTANTANSTANTALSIANTASSDASTALTRTQYQSASASNTAFSSTITCNNLTTSSYNVNTELLSNRNDRITNWIYDSIRNIVFFYTRFDLPKMYLVAGETTERMIGASVTLTNTALETCSRGKPAWRVTAIDGHVQLGGGLTVTSTSETWSLVVAFGNINRAQMDDASDKNYVLFMQTYGWSNVNSNLNHCISYNPKLLRLYFEETNGSSTYQSMDIDDFANKLVCFCHDNTNMYVYVEGVLTYTVSNPNPYTGTQCNYITLLNRNSTNLRPLEHVQLCAISLYDYTLTQSLINKMYWDDIVK